MNEVLSIKNLIVRFNTGMGALEAVRGVSLCVYPGEILALVGESGCGKSVTARSVLRLNEGAQVSTSATELTVLGKDVLGAKKKELLEIRGGLVGMIFQDPVTYLNPTMKVGRQIIEALMRRHKKKADFCEKEAIRLLELVQIPDAPMRARQYPHELSGGMCQRVMIAMALACGPKLLIADEPTTALDPTIQLQILKLLKKIQKELGTAILLITHDFSVVAHMADRVGVMYGGKIVEEGMAETLFENHLHPYTKGLLGSLPSGDAKKMLQVIPGSPPDLSTTLRGCSFAPRCKYVMGICREKEPEAQEMEEGHVVSCWLYDQGREKGGEE